MGNNVNQASSPVGLTPCPAKKIGSISQAFPMVHSQSQLILHVRHNTSLQSPKIPSLCPELPYRHHLAFCQTSCDVSNIFYLFVPSSSLYDGSYDTRYPGRKLPRPRTLCAMAERCPLTSWKHLPTFVTALPTLSPSSHLMKTTAELRRWTQ